MTYKKWISFGGILLVVFSMGGYFSFYFASKFYMDNYYSSIIAEMVVDVSVLEYLRNDSVNNAIEMLDNRMDVNIVSLDIDNESISKSREIAIKRAFDLTYMYRKKYNIKNDNHDLELLVAKSLQRAVTTTEIIKEK